MTNNEDFFAMAYSGLVLSGLLISIVPAFIASKRNKSFWIWWLFSSFLFTICTTVLIKAQLFSLLLYLLAIVPVVSILALLPSPRSKKTLSHISSVWTASQLGRLYDVYWCLFTLVLAGILYYYLLPHKWDHGRYGDESYSLILALVFVTACLGYLLFILF